MGVISVPVGFFMDILQVHFYITIAVPANILTLMGYKLIQII